MMTNNNNDYFIEEIREVATRDPRKTGAIPRTVAAVIKEPSIYQTTIDKINQGQRVCIIMRGLPGSGKSHLAKQIIEDTIKGTGEGHIISSDNYFMVGNRYVFDLSKLQHAHDFTQRLFFNHASKGYSPLIVDNTNMCYWEMLPYLQGAVQYGYAIEIMEPTTAWKWNANICFKKNVHNVPLQNLQNMRKKYECGNSVDEIIRSYGLTPVAQPKMRLIPPLNSIIDSKDLVNNLIDFSLDDHDNNNKNGNWKNLKSQPKMEEIQDAFQWNPPPQVFEEKWDQLTQKEVTIREKDEQAVVPQPPRKQGKGKKAKSPEEPDLIPHQKGCPNENKNFSTLRELYPDVNDTYIWDLFVNCKGDPDWCAGILFDDDKIENMKDGAALTCNCGSSENFANDVTMSTILAGNERKNQQNNMNGKKQTPIKTKKAKTSENVSSAAATKAAIEASIQIPSHFYPDHVNAVKTWKNPLLPTPNAALESSTPPPLINDQVLALPIDKKLIFELDEKFGQGLLKFAHGQSLPNKIFINESTARQLYEQIMDAYKSHEAESQLEVMKKDLEFAQLLQDKERAQKYPKLFTEPNGNLKEIMENEEAMREYEKEMGGLHKEDETLAQVIKKQRLYNVFTEVDKNEINNLFEVLKYDFNETVKMLQEMQGYDDKKCKDVEDKLANDAVWRSDTSSDESDVEESEEYPADNQQQQLKVLENLREEIVHHLESQKRCQNIASEKRQQKDYHTANYYIEMVAFHKQKVEEKREMVANILSNTLDEKHECNDTLDLHFHTIIEATTRLNTFLDRKISKLREIKRQFVELSIITGRGAHSKNGIATIKNMTIQQLQKRNLRVTESNPGLLKVKIFPNTILSSDIPA